MSRPLYASTITGATITATTLVATDTTTSTLGATTGTVTTLGSTTATIATLTATTAFTLLRTFNGQTIATVRNDSTGTEGEAKFQASNGVGVVAGAGLMEVGMTSTGWTPSGVFAANVGFVHTSSAVGMVIGANSGFIRISAEGNINNVSATFESGRFGIGIAPAYKLDVQGTASTGNVTSMRLYRVTANNGDTNELLWQSADGGSALLTASIKDEVTTGTTGSMLLSTNNGSGLVERVRVNPSGTLKWAAYSSGTATFTAGAKYLVVDATGNILVSALGPAS